MSRIAIPIDINAYKVIDNFATTGGMDLLAPVVSTLGKFWSINTDDVAYSDVSFTSSTKTIASVSQADYSEMVAGSTIRVITTGTQTNDGTYTVASSTASTIVVNESLTDQTAVNADSVQVIRDWTRGSGILKIPASLGGGIDTALIDIGNHDSEVHMVMDVKIPANNKNTGFYFRAVDALKNDAAQNCYWLRVLASTVFNYLSVELYEINGGVTTSLGSTILNNIYAVPGTSRFKFRMDFVNGELTVSAPGGVATWSNLTKYAGNTFVGISSNNTSPSIECYDFRAW